MPTLAPLFRLLPLLAPSSPRSPPSRLAFLSAPPRHYIPTCRPRPLRLIVTACAAFPDDPSSSNGASPSRSKRLYLSKLIQEIEPFDVSVIQKDVPADTVDAMKRTISGMLGLLPSDQFHVLIEALWEPLSKLLVSSMMTGYTLRKAEYQLCLERNLDINDEHFEKIKAECVKQDGGGNLVEGSTELDFSGRTELSEPRRTEEDPFSEFMSVQGLGEVAPETLEYISSLRARLASARQELHEMKRKNAAIQMQQFVGEEKNDLLDYLRSLQPEKVAELSEPTSSELQDIVHSVVHGLLATLSPRMHSKASLQTDNVSNGVLNIWKEDSTELVENSSLHIQPLISVTRDYLARLLFWCMLLGHYLRGLEYRLDLIQLLTLSNGEQSNTEDGELGA